MKALLVLLGQTAVLFFLVVVALMILGAIDTAGLPPELWP